MNVLMWEHFAPGGPLRVGGHHFADRFVRDGARVAWCAGPLSPLNLIRKNEETRARLRLWRQGGAWLAEGRMFAYAPMTWLPHRPYPGFDRPWVQRHTLAATRPRLRAILDRAGFARFDLLWMSPGAPLLALLDDIPHEAAVYRMSDDTAAFPDAPAPFREIEAEACRRAALVIVAASVLQERARELGARRVLHVPNACDPGPFLGDGLPEPRDLAPLARPRALYVGALDWWFDTALVRATARRLPGWSFALIGPSRIDLRPLTALPNVAWLGPRAHGDLPAYLAHADAGLVPFSPGAMTHAIHPIKVYEYCAAGLPVVATRLREIEAMRAPIACADEPADFAAALEATRREGPGAREHRRDYARRHTWDERFVRVREALSDLGVAGAGSAPRDRAAFAGAGR